MPRSAPRSGEQRAGVGDVGVEAEDLVADVLEVVLEALGAGAVPRDRDRAAVRAARRARARGGRSDGRRAVPGAVQDERDVALRALPGAPAGAAVRKFDQPRRLSSTIALRASTSAWLVSGCSAPAASRMSTIRTGGSAWPSTRAGRRRGAARGRTRGAAWRCPRAAARRPRARGGRRRGGRRSGGRPRACRRRRAPRRARSARASSGAKTAERGPMRPAPRRCAACSTRRTLAGGEPGVQHRDGVAEAVGEAADDLGVSPISGTSTIRRGRVAAPSPRRAGRSRSCPSR